MYLGIDVGGTKTLVASLDENGVITEEFRFPTNKDYSQFLLEIKENVNKLKTKEFTAGGVGIPVSVFDRPYHLDVSFSNLPWKNVDVQDDLEKMLNIPIALDNDAKLAGLSESMLLKGKFRRVLYITVSTGIGCALIVDQKIDDNIGDAGGRSIILQHEGKDMPWEDFASGRAIVERFGKYARDITDDKIWATISDDLAQGIIHLIALTEPEVIVFGGSVGEFFDRYKKHLKKSLDKYKIPLVPMPELVQAQRPDQAVVYGAYDLAKQIFDHNEKSS